LQSNGVALDGDNRHLPTVAVNEMSSIAMSPWYDDPRVPSKMIYNKKNIFKTVSAHLEWDTKQFA